MPRTFLKLSRQIHLYFGVFITPAILFFAFTGAIQTAGLHETNRDHPNYVPARWIAVLAQIHKKQNTTLRARPPQAAAAPAAATAAAPAPSEGNPQPAADAARPHHHQDPVVAATLAPQPAPTTQAPAGKKHNPIPMRLFFFVVCLGLFTSTFTGLYMTYKFTRNKLLITATLLAGTILPPLLLLF